MGLVNKVVPLAELEATAVAWGRGILQHSPIAIRCLKAAFNADSTGRPACRSSRATRRCSST